MVRNDKVEMVFLEWKRTRGYGGRRIAAKSADGLNLVEYEFETPPEQDLKGRRLFFFSDVHWGNSEVNLKSIAELARSFKPEWIVFGGDLTNYACFFDEAFEALGDAFSGAPEAARIAVPGNWDRRRGKWFPNLRWGARFAEIGFRYLVNESFSANGILFHGLDDSRNGRPNPRAEALSATMLNCVVSHNPATIAILAEHIKRTRSETENAPKCLCLAGHTHGGQIRVPGFGALLTSTKYWKLFEYGRHLHKATGTEMIVTSGIGTSRLPLRLFCEPEVVLVRFT